MSQRLFLIDDYVVVLGVVVIVVVADNVAATEFDVVVAAAAVIVSHLFVVGLVFSVVAAVSDFEIDDGDSALV